GGVFGNALQAASFEGHQGIVTLLLEKGADVNARGGHCGNALQAASLEGHQGIVILLLDKGADIHAQGGVFGNALQAASLEGHQGIVILLLDKGADIHAQGGEYGNALAASHGGHQGIGDECGDPLQVASLAGLYEPAKMLQRRGIITSSSKRSGSKTPDNPPKALLMNLKYPFSSLHWSLAIAWLRASQVVSNSDMYTAIFPSWDPQTRWDLLLLSSCAIMNRGWENRKFTYGDVY
ncbi:hypothetical protein PENNAL_c0829G01393, partial [Penicillium nalgiovense]